MVMEPELSVVSAIAWIGLFKACFTAAKASQYCSLDLGATYGAWKTFEKAAMPTTSSRLEVKGNIGHDIGICRDDCGDL